jgi:hypothetical protein
MPELPRDVRHKAPASMRGLTAALTPWRCPAVRPQTPALTGKKRQVHHWHFVCTRALTSSKWVLLHRAIAQPMVLHILDVVLLGHVH